jgi:hypothetical protein
VNDAAAIPAPAEFAELAEVVGDAGLLALVEAYGGTRINVGMQPSAGMIDLLGDEAAGALSRVYGGTKLTIPLAKRWRVLIYLSRGLSADAIARRLNVGIDTVWRTKRLARERAARGGQAAQIQQMRLPL